MSKELSRHIVGEWTYVVYDDKVFAYKNDENDENDAIIYRMITGHSGQPLFADEPSRAIALPVEGVEYRNGSNLEMAFDEQPYLTDIVCVGSDDKVVHRMPPSNSWKENVKIRRDGLNVVEEPNGDVWHLSVLYQRDSRRFINSYVGIYSRSLIKIINVFEFDDIVPYLI